MSIATLTEKERTVMHISMQYRSQLLGEGKLPTLAIPLKEQQSYVH